MAPFTAVGETARWRVVYRLLCQTPTGELLTFEQMADALELDPRRHRAVIISALRYAASYHEKSDRRAVESVRGVGYRVVLPDEHLKLAHHHGRKSGAQLKLAYGKTVNVDLSLVEPEVRKALETLSRGFLDQMEINRRLLARQDRMEESVLIVSERQTRTEEEYAQMQERLAQIEKLLK
jgi:hypothetical protein